MIDTSGDLDLPFLLPRLLRLLMGLIISSTDI